VWRGAKRSFASSTNDQLLVVYLSSLLRAVIALHVLADKGDLNFAKYCTVAMCRVEIVK